MASSHETPIAGDYLEVRGELGTVLGYLTELAIEANAPACTIQTLGNLQGGLRDPFLFVVAGEVKAGKSSLLNALFGAEFCKVDVLPATDRVHVFKFGEVAREVPLHPELVEHYHPIGFLRDFNVVDTPGTNTVVTQHQRITEQFAPLADLILFVFSVVNPWGASAWEFLEHLQRKWLKNVVFIVQQIDLREEREVRAVVDHLKQTATARFGRAFPVYPVSAKKAFLSKTSGVDKARLWAESGFGPLEDYINEAVGTGDERREKLRSIARTAQVILGDLAADAQAEGSRLEADRAELERVMATVETHRGRTGITVEAFLHALDTAFARCLHQGEHMLQGRLRGLAGRLFGSDARWLRHFQRNFESMLHAAIARQMSHAFDLLEAETRSVWTQLRESLRANLSPVARERLTNDQVDFAEQRPRLVERIESVTVEILTDEESERSLGGSLRAIGSAIQVPTWLAVILLITAGVTAGTGLIPIWVGGAVAGAAILIGVLGFAIAARRRARALAAYREHTAAKQAELGEKISAIVGQAIEAFYARVEAVYTPLDAFCRGRVLAQAPLLERFDRLDHDLKRVAARL